MIIFTFTFWWFHFVTFHLLTFNHNIFWQLNWTLQQTLLFPFLNIFFENKTENTTRKPIVPTFLLPKFSPCHPSPITTLLAKMLLRTVRKLSPHFSHVISCHALSKRLRLQGVQNQLSPVYVRDECDTIGHGSTRDRLLFVSGTDHWLLMDGTDLQIRLGFSDLSVNENAGIRIWEIVVDV